MKLADKIIIVCTIFALLSVAIGNIYLVHMRIKLRPDKPYVLILDGITDADKRACKADENCMDLIDLKDWKAQ